MTIRLSRPHSLHSELALRVTFQSVDGLEHTGTIRELSTRGAFIETRQHLRESVTVALQIPSPTSWEPIRVNSVVLGPAASTPSGGDLDKGASGFRVSFANLSTEHADAIRALLEVSGFDDA